MLYLQHFMIIFIVSGVWSTPNSTYTTKYDDIDLDEILTNDRLLAGYVKCLLETGGCTPDGKELKHNLPDAIENDCENCSEKQRIGSESVMHYLIDHRPEDWTLLEQKYNPDGSYRINYLERKDLEENDHDENGRKMRRTSN